jgi:CHAD domain-containing protein
MTRCVFQLGNEPELKTIKSGLRLLFEGNKSRTVRNSMTYFDTFDWRLYDEGFRLKLSDKKLYLESIKDPYLKQNSTIRNIPRRVAHIHSERMREILSPIVEVRALLPIVHLNVHEYHIHLLDKERKTTVRCLIEHATVEDNDRRWNLPFSLVLTSVKGYEKAFEKTKEWLYGGGFTTIKSDLLIRALQVQGKRPGDYSSQIRINFDPAMPVAQAAQKILAHLFRTMRKNESGLIDDIDVEFLHDYRVSVRRIRSLFEQLKNVFHESTYKQAKKDFSEIGRLTNKMRDIDVYLLREESYKSMLPPAMKEEINPFFDDLNTGRIKELEKIKKYLSKDPYKQIMHRWIAFSNAPVGDVASTQGEKPVYEYAQKIILKRYRKLIKLGRSIKPETGDEYLHRLRIECKKLRYLMEFFLSLFPRQKMNMLIRHLKKLQDNLGLYNDLSIQQATLHEYVSKIDADPSETSILAVGVLIGRLYQEYRQVRSAFSEIVERFSSPDMIKLFEDIFHVKTDDKQ